MTRKAPSGARHSACLDHVAHDYARSGWLCITTNAENRAWPQSAYVADDGRGPRPGRPDRDMQPVDRAADMVAFANHLAAVAARHRVTGSESWALLAPTARDGTRAYGARLAIDGEPIAGPLLAECEWRHPVLSSQLAIPDGAPAPCAWSQDVAPCMLRRYHPGDHVAVDGTRTSRTGALVAGPVAAVARAWPYGRAADTAAIARLSRDLSARLGRAPIVAEPVDMAVLDPVAPVAEPAPVARKTRARKTAPAPTVDASPVDALALWRRWYAMEDSRPAGAIGDSAYDAWTAECAAIHAAATAAGADPGAPDPVAELYTESPANLAAIARATAPTDTAAWIDNVGRAYCDACAEPGAPGWSPMRLADLDYGDACDACNVTLRPIAEPERSTVVDYTAPMPAGFAIVDPFGALARPIAELEPAPVASVSAEHVGYTWTVESGLSEVFTRGASVMRAPLANPIGADGYRAGREWWPTGDRYATLWRPLTWSTVADAERDMLASHDSDVVTSGDMAAFAADAAEDRAERLATDPAEDPGPRPVDALALCNACDLAPAVVDSAAGYCAECERSAREPVAEPVAPAVDDLGIAYERMTQAEYARARHDILYAHTGPDPVADAPADPAPVAEPSPDPATCPYTVGTGPGASRCIAGAPGHDGAHEWPTVAERRAAERERAMHAAADGMYGPVATRKRASRRSRTARRARPDRERARATMAPGAEPIGQPVAPAEPAPVAPILAAVPAPVDGRPTCPRCGQRFRKSGAGLAWHLANRPDCAGPVAPSLSVAS